jgi:holo-[acyl-carrier protein] synthase
MNGALVGIGIDSVDIPRFAEVLARRPGLAPRLFTAGEQRYAAGLVNPMPSLAARFAVKEAVMKALGVGLGAFGWADVEVVRAPSGAPDLVVTGRAAALASRQGVGSWRLSITHTATVASAVVAAVA